MFALSRKLTDKATMSRPSLQFLRPYLYRNTSCLRPQHAQAYLSVQRRLKHTTADAFTGPHDVEKQKRLDQLKNVKPLGDYHPQLVYPGGAEALSLRDFNARFADIQETKTENVSVFGRIRSVRLSGSKLMFLDIERDTQRLQIMVERKKLSEDDSEDKFKSLKKVARVGDWICKSRCLDRASSMH
jgi:lysyl-tRNA synthetase class 2